MSLKLKIIVGLLFIVYFILSQIYIFRPLNLYWHEIFELKTLDFRYLIRGNDNKKKDVVVIAMDEESIITMEATPYNDSWPWQRRWYGMAIQNAFDAGVKGIGMDISFTTPDENDIRNDMYLSSVFSSYPKVVIGGYILFDKKIYDAYPKEYKEKMKENIFYLNNACKIKNFEGVNQMQLTRYYKIIPSIPEFSSYVPMTALDVGSPDADGVIRNLPLIINEVWGEDAGFGYTILPHFDLLILKTAIGAKDIVINYKTMEAEVGKYRIPFDQDGVMNVFYYGDGEKVIPTIPFVKVLKGEIPKDYLKDKIAVIGYTTSAKGLYDMRNTPFNRSEAGIYIHAQAIQNMLSHDFLTRPNVILRSVYIAMAIILSLLLLLFKDAYKKLIALIVPLMIFVIGYAAFLNRIWLDIFYPFLATFIFIAIDIILSFLSEFKEKRKVKSFLYKYVADTVANELMKGKTLDLGGKEYEVVIIFSDIQGFTEKSEKLTPAQVVEFLNQYLTTMAEVIRNKYNGTIDKFIGDAIMTYFGAPVKYGDEIHRALDCAIDMKIELRKLNERLNLPFELKNGIGIHYGPVTVGNIGAPFRMDYTAIGDTVNTASRIEHLTRDLSREILVSEVIYDQVKDDYIFEYVGDHSVKGKAKPLKIYSLKGRKNGTTID